MKIRKALLAFVTLIILGSCEKPEGIGGKGEISGTITVKVYDKDFKVLQDSFPAADEDVFIIYGDNDILSDETNTSYNGKYSFKNLSKGNYTLFVYSDDNTGLSVNDILVDTLVELSNHTDKISDLNFTIYNTVDYDDGRATIKGNIQTVIWFKDFLGTKDTINAQEQDVYLLYEDKFIERTRTLQDGSYSFPGLLKGNYKIIAYSEDIFQQSDEMIAVIKPVTINSTNEMATVENMYVAKED